MFVNGTALYWEILLAETGESRTGTWSDGRVHWVTEKGIHRIDELYAKNDYKEFSRGIYYCSKKLQRLTERKGGIARQGRGESETRKKQKNNGSKGECRQRWEIEGQKMGGRELRDWTREAQTGRRRLRQGKGRLKSRRNKRKRAMRLGFRGKKITWLKTKPINHRIKHQ